MMGCVLILLLTTLFAVTVSQLVEITADKMFVKDGERVVFTCKVPDFTDNVFVKQGSNNRAVCFANNPCSSTDTSAYTVTNSGTTVIFTILSFSKARDEGSWIVSYGSGSDSNPVVISEYIASTASTLTTATNSSALVTSISISSSTLSTIQLHNSTECCFIKYILHYDKWVCDLSYFLLVFVVALIVIFIIYLCKRQRQCRATSTGESEYEMSDIKTPNTAPTSKTNSKSTSLCHDHINEGNQHVKNDLQTKTKRFPEKASSRSYTNTLQEDFSTKIQQNK